ncbi:MAG: Zinc transporter ZupT [Microgenomates bacterium OLB22]|nr:MAG: Zinc transporter ZupT [Microgenomates bacterium OLB22]
MELILIILANLLVSAVALIGVFLLVNVRLKSETITTYFVSFAAGTMLATACLTLLEEALHGSVNHTFALWSLLGGMVASFILERTLLWYHHHHEDTHDIRPSAFLILIGDVIHNFIDGIAISAAFMASPLLGWAATASIATHELPQEFADMSVLLHSGMKPRKALLWNFLSGLTAIVGGIVGFYFLGAYDGAIPYVLAFTAGLFIYISCADLIPSLHENSGGKRGASQLLLFLLGVTFMAGIVSLSPHGHEDNEPHNVQDQNIPYTD